MIPLTRPNLVVPVVPSLVPNWIPAGCRVWYGMQEGAGPGLSDLSGNGVDGVISGASWEAGPGEGWVLSFDGADDYVTLSPVIAAGGKTFEFWIKPGVVTWGYLSDVANGRLLIRFDTGYSGKMSLSNAGTAYVFTTVLQVGLWYHLVLSIIVGETPVLYVNGIAETAAGASASTAVGGAVVLGAYCVDPLTNEYTGKMGLFRLFDRGLSAVEAGVLFAHDRARYGI